MKLMVVSEVVQEKTSITLKREKKARLKEDLSCLHWFIFPTLHSIDSLGRGLELVVMRSL
jgi:hypothetical protein